MGCSDLPPLVSSFVDAFVDFSVSGIFFPSNDSLNAATAPPLPPAKLPAPRRLVAIGDLHGDFLKARDAFLFAGIIDPAFGRWTGGDTVAVQVGDVLDRGGDELRLLYQLHRLKLEAAAAGGALLTILGNHEIMNLAGDFRFATPHGLSEFVSWSHWFRAGLVMKRLCGSEYANPFRGIPKSFPGIKPEFWEGIRARFAALRPDGPISRRFIAGNPVVVVVGDSVFVHGGLLENHVAYGIEKINEEVREWVLGKDRSRRGPESVVGRDSVVWLRKFSDGPNCDCQQLEEVLAMMPGVKRMVMGHTIQAEGITAVCNDRAVRVDVGLSKGCGDGTPEVLEIVGRGKEIRVLTADPSYGWRHRAQDKEREVNAGLAWLAREGGLKEVEVNA